MKKYSLGETIRVELDLQDVSGVSGIIATFNEVQSGRAISMSADGGGQTQAKVVLTSEVTQTTVPGEYRCQYVQVYDARGNHKTHTPDIRFIVENVPGDHEGPELVSWHLQ